MKNNLDEILKIILHTAVQLEEDMKQESDLKNLTSRQITFIELVKELKNPNLSELAEKMNITKASLSVMAERLESKQYIIKVISDNDRRTAHIHLTEKGEKAAGLHEELHKRISAMLTKKLTDSEKQILNVLLDKSIHSFLKLKNENK